MKSSLVTFGVKCAYLRVCGARARVCARVLVWLLTLNLSLLIDLLVASAAAAIVVVLRCCWCCWCCHFCFNQAKRTKLDRTNLFTDVRLQAAAASSPPLNAATTTAIAEAIDSILWKEIRSHECCFHGCLRPLLSQLQKCYRGELFLGSRKKEPVPRQFSLCSGNLYIDLSNWKVEVEIEVRRRNAVLIKFWFCCCFSRLKKSGGVLSLAEKGWNLSLKITRFTLFWIR